MRAILGSCCIAIAASTFVPTTAAWAQCPPGYAQISHWIVKQGEDEIPHWKCKWGGPRAARNALQQLRNMGEGYVDTTTGFDGGQGPNAAVATAPAAVAAPNMSVVTVADLEKFGKDPAYSEAVASHHYAAEARKEAEAKVTALRQAQAKMTDSLERQKAQIAIHDAEKALTAAKGEERIAENAVIKEVIRLKPQVLIQASTKKKKK